MQSEVVGPLSADAKEFRRLRAWELFQSGWKQADIARALGVTSGAVSQWVKRAREGGTPALQKGAVGGSQPRLTPEQHQQLERLLRQGAEAFGFRGNVWTQARVAAVIEREFGIKYHPFHMYRVLRRIGWSQQKPERRAQQRKEAAIDEWQKERWPALKQTP
jgi:transposase